MNPWFGPAMFAVLVVGGPLLGRWLLGRPPRVSWVLFGLSLVPVVALTLVPVQRELYARCTVEWVLPTFGRVELMANVLLFVPPVLLAPPLAELPPLLALPPALLTPPVVTPVPPLLTRPPALLPPVLEAPPLEFVTSPPPEQAPAATREVMPARVGNRRKYCVLLGIGALVSGARSCALSARSNRTTMPGFLLFGCRIRTDCRFEQSPLTR